MKMGKKLMVFRPPFGLNNEYGGNFKGGCPPVNWGSKGVAKVNGGQNICNRVASVGNGKNFEKQAQSSKG